MYGIKIRSTLREWILVSNVFNSITIDRNRY